MTVHERHELVLLMHQKMQDIMKSRLDTVAMAPFVFDLQDQWIRMITPELERRNPKEVLNHFKEQITVVRARDASSPCLYSLSVSRKHSGYDVV